MANRISKYFNSLVLKDTSDYKTIHLTIEGMTCQGCVHNITASLSELDGVKKTKVKLEKKETKIIYDAALISTEPIVQKVEDAGFTVTDIN